MGYREFSGSLDGQGTTYVEFDGELDDAARRPLPPWTAPSKAGAGRGFVNPPAVEPPGLLDRAASVARDALQAGEVATPVRRRGGVRGEFKPFVGGDERIERAATIADGITADPLARPSDERPDALAQWQVDAEYLSRSPESQRQEQAAHIYEGRIANAPTIGPGPAPRGVDVAADAVRNALDAGGSRTLAGQAAGKGTQLAGDLALSTIRIVPETLQLANDILQLGTGGLTQGFSRVMEATSNVIGEQQSTELAREHAELMGIMRDPDAGPSEVAGFLLTHPEYSMNAALPSVGSMALGAGGGRLGAQFAKALAARRGAVGAEIAAAMDRGAAVGATAANAAMNAGSTFDQTRGDLSDKYLAAGIAGAGTAAAGKFFDGGAEAMLARRAVAASRPSAIAGTAIKEAGQEGFESMSQGIGQATGEGRPLDPDALAKQATLEGALGGIIGGAAGVSLPVAGQEQTAEQLARAKGFLRPVERAQAIDRRVDDFAVEYGVLPKAIAAVKAEGARRSLAERVPYYKRAMAALAKHGLVSRQLDAAALTMLDESGEDLMEPDAREASEGRATVDAGRLQGGGAAPLQGRQTPAADQRGSGGAPIAVQAAEARKAPVSSPAVSIERQLADRLAEQFGIGAEAADGDASAAAAPDAAGPAADDAALTPIDQAAHDAATSPTNDLPEPTDAQKEAGNYKVGRVRIDGMSVSIENPKGSIRRSKADAARPWQVEMPAHYGYIRGTNGADGDHVDLFIGDGGENGRYWVINQNQPDSSKFDEHKVVTGVDSAEAAVDLYKRSFADSFGEKVFASVSGEFDGDGIKAKLPEMSKPRAVKGGANAPATPSPAPVLAYASKPTTVSKRQGALVETWAGRQKQGMLIHAAHSQMRDQQKRRPDLQWSIVPAPEFAEDRFKLEGREPVAEFETGERITIDGEPATVAKVAKAHIVAQTDGGKKRVVAFDSPTMERIRAARKAAPATTTMAVPRPEPEIADELDRRQAQAAADGARETAGDVEAQPAEGAQAAAVAGQEEGGERAGLTLRDTKAPVDAAQAAARQIADAIAREKETDEFADFALRALPEGDTSQVGDTLAPSLRWVDGEQTDEELPGTSAIRVASPHDEAAAVRALRQVGATGLPPHETPNGVYRGSVIALVKGESVGAGEDVGEVVIRDAEIVSLWRRGSDPWRSVVPNESSAPTSSGADLLTAQTPADLKTKAESESSAKAADAAEQKRLADKAKADAEAGEFSLTGSDRAADVAAAGGQQDLLERAPIAASGAVGNFGQALPPSRRQRRSMLDEALSAEDIRAKPLSEIWPAAENEAIEDKFAAAVAHAAREEIPAKPRKGYKLDRWIDKVQTLRDMAQRIVSGEVSRERFMDKSRDYKLGGFISKVALLEAIDRSQWKRIGQVQEHPHAYTYVDGKQTPAPQVLVEIDDRARRFEGSGSLADHLEAINELLGTPISDKRMQFEIRTDRKGRYFINKKGDSEQRELMEFNSAEAARTAMRERYGELVAAWEAVKERDNVTERDLRSDANRDRVGEDWRKGRDITGDEFDEQFGFVGGEFGKWVEQGKGDKERQWMLNRAYDALMDLSRIVGVPPRALSLNGSIGIAFGARGSGWASAHFEPDTLVINLTKTRGAGALAHEWFHALDNYFSRLRGGEVKAKTANDYRRQNFVTYKPEPLMVRRDGRGTAVSKTRLEEWRASNPNSPDLAVDKWQPDPKHPQGVRPQVEERFAELVKALEAAPFTKRSRAIDHVKNGGEGYWSQVIERAARSFESYVIHKMMQQGHHNDYLANVTPLEKFRRDPSRYPYPTPAEIAPIAEAFDDLFGTIETRTDEAGNVAMFSRSESTRQAYERRVDELFGGRGPRQFGARILDRSDVLAVLGEPARPMHLAESKVVTDKHNLTATHWKRLPQWLENPIAVFDSDTVDGRLVFLGPELVDGAPVLMVVKPNASLGYLDVDLLVNAYDKDESRPPVERWVREGKLRYVDEEASPAFGGTSGLRLPGVNRLQRGSDRTVATRAELVKLRGLRPDAPATSRGTGAGMSIPDAEAAISVIRSALPKAPPLIPLDDVRKAPAVLARHLKRIGAENDVEAAYYAGSVYVFPQHIASIDRFMFVVGRHEIRHYGFDAMLGRRRGPVLLGIAMKNQELMAEAQQKLAEGKASNLIGGIEEALADMPVERIESLTGIDRLIAAVRQWLRELAARLREKGHDTLAAAVEPEAWTDRDIAAFVRKAEDVSRVGGASKALGRVATSRGEDPERLALRALSENDDLFALPKSDKTTVEDIAANNDPTIKVRATVISSQETMYRLTMADGSVAFITQRKPNPYGSSVYGYESDDTTPITTRPGDNPDDAGDADDVWIDVSRLKQGGDGDMIYNIAATYAHNTGRIFIGDPAGVSSDAMRRRSEHMLSSALKFGTTRHLAPHPDQVTGKDGVPGLSWVYGDDLGNIRRLVDLAVRKMENDFPESKNLIYDPATGEFSNAATGKRHSPASLAGGMADARADRGVGRTALAGGRTAARAAVWRALLREEGSASGGQGQRDGLLARLARVASDLADAEPKQRIFYSRGAEPRLSRQAGQPAQQANLPLAPTRSLWRDPAGHVQFAPGAARIELPSESPARWLQRKTQDSLNRFNVVRDWAIEHGVDMTTDSNVWAFEERMHGRVATRVEDFRERRLRPLVKAVQAAGFTMEEVAEFLHAQHAAERNRQIAKIDPQSTAGSGMTDEEAARILGSADPKLAALANEVRSISEDTRRILLESGIISKEMADAWQAAYQHYVPLKGDLQAKTGTGKGLSVNGRQHRALGHGQRDEHIVENVLRDHERAILLAEKNTVGHALLAFVSELSNDDIATVGKPVKRKALVHSTVYEVANESGSGVATFDSLEAANAYIRSHPGEGLTTHAVKADPHVAYLASSALADNEVQVYVEGHAIRVQLNDPLLANAYRAIGVERLNRLLALNREVNTWLSKAYTGLNPEFLLVNISRDFSTGVINIVANYGAGVAAKAIASYPKAFASVLRYSFGGEATPMLRAYRDAGGSTGAAYLSDLERVGLDVKNAYDDYQGVAATMKDGRPTDALGVASRKLLGAFAGWVEHLNAAGENAMRLAVFDALRSTTGYTVNDAASAAKNATVNFNRKGEWGQVLNSMYLFYNANVQGTAAMVDALAHGKHRGQAWTLLAMLPAAAYALAAAQFDDDEWRRIPDYVKSRNVIIRTGAKTYATLPIPYGYGWFWSLGNAAFDLRHGRDIDKVALNIANGLLENFSPVNPLGDDPDPRGLVELLPGAVGGELMRAAARLAVNRSGLGRDIVPDSKFDENRPDSLRMWRSTKGTFADKTAGTLNRWTGGTKTQSGAIDVSPETLRYWASTLTGGAGTFLSDTMGLAGLGLRYAASADAKEAAALAPELREIPVVRKFVRQDDIRDARAAYWAAVKEANDAVADFERARKADDAPGKAATREKADLLKPMVRMSQAMNKEIKAHRDRVETIMADDSASLARKRIALRAVEAEEQRLYDKYVSAFDAKVRRLSAPKAAKLPVPAETN